MFHFYHIFSKSTVRFFFIFFLFTLDRLHKIKIFLNCSYIPKYIHIFFNLFIFQVSKIVITKKNKPEASLKYYKVDLEYIYDCTLNKYKIYLQLLIWKFILLSSWYCKQPPHRRRRRIIEVIKFEKHLCVSTVISIIFKTVFLQTK